MRIAALNRNTCLTTVLMILAGCASNPYAKFYQPAPDEILRTIAQRRVQAPPHAPELLRGTNPQAALSAIAAEG